MEWSLLFAGSWMADGSGNWMANGIFTAVGGIFVLLFIAWVANWINERI